jgi:hypothetical protein
MLSALHFEFSHDAAEQIQYRDLYMEQCRVKDDPHFLITEERFDERSHVMVIWNGDLCIGGARLTVRGPHDERALPMEIDGFALADCFPDLAADDLHYAEISRFTLLPDFRNRHTILEMFRQIHSHALTLDVDRLYAAAPIANLRLYRQCCAVVGVPLARIRQDIRLPLYCTIDGVEDFLFEAAINDRGLAGIQPAALAS